MENFVIGTPNNPGTELVAGVGLGALAGWVLPEFVEFTKSTINTTRPLRQVCGGLASNDAATYIVMSPLYPKDPSAFVKNVPLEPGKTAQIIPKHSMPWVFVENDSRALAFMLALLAIAGKKSNVSIVRDDESLNLHEGHFICIGSPKSNLKSRQLMEMFIDTPIEFIQLDEGKQFLKSKISGLEWHKQDKGADFGLILKTRDPSDSKNLVVLIAGISHVGTGAAGWYFWRHWKLLANEFGDGSFAVILSAQADFIHSCKQVYRSIRSTTGWNEVT